MSDLFVTVAVALELTTAPSANARIHAPTA